MDVYRCCSANNTFSIVGCWHISTWVWHQWSDISNRADLVRKPCDKFYWMGIYEFRSKRLLGISN